MANDLTILAVVNAKADAERREIPDGKLRGLWLVVQPSGAKSWAVRYRPKDEAGKALSPKKLTLGSYPSIDLARDALNVVANGGDPAAEKQAKKAEAPAPRRDLVENVAASFVERYARPKQKAATARETERILTREVVPVWKGRGLASITRADVHELLDAVSDRGSPIMSNRVLAAVRKMFNWAIDRGIVTANPCSNLKGPGVEQSRDRVLDGAMLDFR